MDIGQETHCEMFPRQFQESSNYRERNGCHYCQQQVHTYLFELQLSILLGVFPELESLDHVEIGYLIFGGTTLLCSTLGCTTLHSHQPGTSILVSLHPHQDLLFGFSIAAVLMDVECLCINL
jgi:hypothetical protein